MSSTARYINGEGGWQYMQFADGTIIITEDPDGEPMDKVLQSGRAFHAITDEIGEHPDSDVEARVVKGNGGWVYEQFEDGTIVVVACPAPHDPGAVLTRGRAFEAITDEIGGYYDD